MSNQTKSREDCKKRANLIAETDYSMMIGVNGASAGDSVQRDITFLLGYIENLEKDNFYSQSL